MGNAYFTSIVSRIGSIAVSLLLVTSLLVGAAGTAVADQQAPVNRPALVTDLAADGSAAMTLVLTYDLTTETDRQAFTDLRESNETVADIASRFESRMREVVASAANRTGRNIQLTDTTVSFAIVDSGTTGVVRLTATVDNLAAVENGQMVMTAPFASGFYSERPVIVRIPAGYSVSSVHPAPDSSTDTTLTWESGTDFEGFALLLESTGTGTPSEGTTSPTSTTTPGFGVSIAAIGLFAAGLVYRLRHQR
ncbi:MAG: PGF-CTERM sorting domain-containing protein [Halodesulfurarchaeum sp.]